MIRQLACALAITGCSVSTAETEELDEDQTLTVEEALGPGCWNFDKGGIGRGLRYLHLPGYSFSGTQDIHALRIDNDDPRVGGINVSKPVSPFLSTAEFGKRNPDIKVAINGDFRNNQNSTWGLWKSKDEVWENDNGNPFMAYGPQGEVSFFPERTQTLPAASTPGRAVISGYPELVKNGVVTAGPDCKNHADLCTGKHPRTASGLSKNGRYLYWLVVDGRRPGAAGLTTQDLAKLMKNKLCVESALNHDGGGSSTMWIRGKGVVNVCSDGPCRHLVNHQGVRQN
jgi:exopolysaccharide biosynthesis protein